MKHFLHTLMGCLLLVSMTACEKDTMPEIFAPKVETGVAENIYRKGATLSGSIQLSEGVKAESYGILFSNYQSMAEATEIPVTSGETNFSIEMQDLEPNKTYYFCTYAYSGYSMIRGEVRSFTTSQSNAPVFQTPVVSNRTVSSFDITSTLLDDGGSELMLSGFCYNEEGENDPTFMDNVVNVETSGNSISATINALQPGKTYQVRAYGASGNGLAYSGMVTVTTGEAVVPFLSLEVKSHEDDACNVDITVKLLEEGSAPLTDLGVHYSINNPVPTIEDENFIFEKEANEYSFSLNGLVPNVTYYFRAYATNEYGTGYSDVVAYTPEIKIAEIAYLCHGETFNERIKQLVNGNVMTRMDVDSLIQRIEFKTGIISRPTVDYAVVSSDDSQTPIYASFNKVDGVLTVSTPSNNIEIMAAYSMFCNLRALQFIDFGKFKINKTTFDLSYMFWFCYSLQDIDCSDWDTSNVVNMCLMFEDCKSLVALDVPNWNTSNVEDMERMFSGCENLKSLNLSNWDVSNLAAKYAMFDMFSYCIRLSKLDISNWVLKPDVYCNFMFSQCASTSKYCEITATQAMQEFLLERASDTFMEPSYFIWVNANASSGNSFEDIPNQGW